MSYDVELCDPVTRRVLEVDQPHHMRGAIYDPRGMTRLELDVTSNYSFLIARALTKAMQGLRSLDDISGMTGADSIPVLMEAVAALADDAEEDYWKATEGNAKQALCHLLAMARMRPDGVWRVL